MSTSAIPTLENNQNAPYSVAAIEFRLLGFEYTQLKRLGDVAIYRQSKRVCPMATRWYASKSTKLSVRLVKIFRLVNPIRVLSNGDQTAGRTERWKMPNRNFRSFPVAGRIELEREVPNRGAQVASFI